MGIQGKEMAPDNNLSVIFTVTYKNSCQNSLFLIEIGEKTKFYSFTYIEMKESKQNW